METLLLDLALGFTIGLTLGLLGGGGSILTVPVLVYLVGQTPQAAVTTSLAIVGANSAFGAVFHRRSGALNPRVALLFGGAGMITAYLAAGLSKLMAPALLMVLFAALMLVIGGMMLRQARPVPAASQPEPLPHQPRLWLTLAAGAVVGMLTGILGVGGGFLIVPALVMLVGLPMYQAVGTSLAVIAANSAAGLLGHLGGPLDLWLTLVFAAAGIAGTFAGVRMAHRLPARRLRQFFAAFVLVLGIFLLFDNLPAVISLRGS